MYTQIEQKLIGKAQKGLRAGTLTPEQVLNTFSKHNPALADLSIEDIMTLSFVTPFDSSSYIRVATDAPKAYDYSYCLDTVASDNELLRAVFIPHDSYNYQTARYASGLHTFKILT